MSIKKLKNTFKAFKTPTYAALLCTFTALGMGCGAGTPASPTASSQPDMSSSSSSPKVSSSSSRPKVSSSSSYSSSSPSNSSASSSSAAVNIYERDGTVLFEENCKQCHSINTSEEDKIGGDIAGDTASGIRYGINNHREMQHLTWLIDEQLEALVKVMTRVKSREELLHDKHCSACHGDEIVGRSVKEITDAIRYRRKMKHLTYITEEEIEAISRYRLAN